MWRQHFPGHWRPSGRCSRQPRRPMTRQRCQRAADDCARRLRPLASLRPTPSCQLTTISRATLPLLHSRATLQQQLALTVSVCARCSSSPSARCVQVAEGNEGRRQDAGAVHGLTASVHSSLFIEGRAVHVLTKHSRGAVHVLTKHSRGAARCCAPWPLPPPCLPASPTNACLMGKQTRRHPCVCATRSPSSLSPRRARAHARTGCGRIRSAPAALHACCAWRLRQPLITRRAELRKSARDETRAACNESRRGCREKEANAVGIRLEATVTCDAQTVAAMS